MGIKILFFDIETSPNLAYVWGKWQQDVIAYAKEWELLSFAWKWSGDSRVRCLTREGQKDDKALAQNLRRILAKADVIVAHNGDDFDMRKARARFLYHGLAPLPPTATVDTKKVAKSRFNLNSNSLNDIGKHLGLGQKKQTGGFDLWLKCLAGDKKAWKKMADYNKQDVILLEKVYEKLKPWMLNHPSLARLGLSKDGCPTCGSHDVKRDGVRANHKSLQQQWKCKSCGGYFLTALKKIRDAK